MIPLTIPPEILLPATILLVHRRGLVAAGIRWVTWSKWNHVALIEGALHGDDQRTIEAQGDGVSHRTIADYCADESVRGLAVYDWPGLTMVQRWAICEWADRHNGADYDTWQLVGIWLRRRFPFLRRVLPQMDDPERPICSELVGRGYASRAINVCPPGVSLCDLAPCHFPLTMERVWEGWRT